MKSGRKPKHFVKFNLNEEELACFKSVPSKEILGKKLENARDAKTLFLQNLETPPSKIMPYSMTEPIRERSRVSSFRNNFNERVVIM